MSDIPFDIDDILNEINRKKEEIEREINSVSANAEVAAAKIVDEAIEKAAVAEAPAEIPAEEPPAEEVVEEAPADEVPVEETADEAPAEEAPVDKAPVEEAPAADDPFENEELNAAYFEDVDRIFAETENGDTPAEEASEAEEGVNIFDFAEGIPEAEADELVRSNKKDKKWNKTKKGKILTAVIIALAVVLLGTGIFGFFYVNGILNDITDDNPKGDGSKIEEWNGMDQLIVKFDDIYEESNVSSYRDMAKKWYYNGEPASSTNIYNVLLIGEDTRGDEIKDEGTLADSVIIGSVNIESGELILTSILRDTYAYYELVPGDESTGTYGKINECMSKGDLSAYINAVERLFKINIDNYVLVNFSNFKKIIDSLGGVTIDITAKEIREINNHPKVYGNVYIDGDAGSKKLTGEQALAYCRIRHIDGDDVRADRQKTVLMSVFNQLKSASVMKLTSVVSNLLPYVKTGFSKSEILSIGQYALKNGWLSYKIVTHTVPKNGTRADGTPITVCVGGKGSNFYNTWCWKVDFPLAAQVLQEKVYGKTNITLAENRPNFKNLRAY